MTIETVHQQSIASLLGEDKALRACLPTCFYILARAYGYLGDVSLTEFVDNLDWERSRDPEHGWFRARLSQELREQYHLPIVSWKLNGDVNMPGMVEAGYISSQHEDTWFVRNAADWPVEVIVAAGTPVIATVKPGFAANKNKHAIVLASLHDDAFEVIDPDERNPKTRYTLAEIRAALAPDGAASVVLPPES